MTSGWLGRLVRRYELCSFFVLAYLISWLVWTPWVLSVAGFGVLDVRFPTILGDTQLAGLLPGAYLGPLAAAFVVTTLTEGRDGLRRWRRRLFAWRVGWRWYAVVLLGLPLALLAGLLLVAGGEAGGGAGWAALWTYVPILVLQVLTSGLAEEPGWRDFALTRLQRRHGPLVATAILAPLWAGWHLPLFLTTWGAGVDLLPFFLLCLTLSVVITWVYNCARESLPLIILLHANVNAFTMVVVEGFFPSSGRTDSRWGRPMTTPVARRTAPTVRRHIAMLTTALSAATILIGCAWNPTEVRRSNTYAGNVVLVEVEVDSHDIRIVGSDRPDIQVDRTLRHTGREPDERIDHHDGGVLAITTQCSHAPISISIGCGGTYEIRVPHGTRVELANGTSSISVEDTRGDADLRSDEGTITVDGQVPTVRAATGTGAIRMNLTGTDRVEARSDEGEVTVTGGVRSAETTTGVGSIRMDLTGGAHITGHSDEGSVTVTTTGPLEALTASSGAGDITLTVPAGDARYDARATSDVGRTIVEVPTATGGTPLRAKSDEGNITIRAGGGPAGTG